MQLHTTTDRKTYCATPYDDLSQGVNRATSYDDRSQDVNCEYVNETNRRLCIVVCDCLVNGYEADVNCVTSHGDRSQYVNCATSHDDRSQTDCGDVHEKLANLHRGVQLSCQRLFSGRKLCNVNCPTSYDDRSQDVSCATSYVNDY